MTHDPKVRAQEIRDEIERKISHDARMFGVAFVRVGADGERTVIDPREVFVRPVGKTEWVEGPKYLKNPATVKPQL